MEDILLLVAKHRKYPSGHDLLLEKFYLNWGVTVCLAINYITGERKQQRFTFFSNSCDKCSVFLGDIKKDFLRILILTPKVQSFNCCICWC